MTLVNEPGTTYIGHVSPKSGSAADIEDKVSKYIQGKSSLDTSKLNLVGCDGTPVNTGPNSGIMRRFEVRLQRPLQRVVCLLHLNELPLRHLMQNLDGPTKGPATTSGPIGKAILQCENLPIVRFQRIAVDWIQDV